MDQSNRFQRFMPFVFKWEGGYDNDPDDPGGETKYGIDKRSHPKEDIRNLTKTRATQIYFHDYWQRNECGSFPFPLGEVYFNCCVNCGPGRAEKILEEPKDAAGFLDAQDAFYRRLADARPAARKYLKGWLNRTADLRQYIASKDMKQFLPS